jgi:hypothetical protein
MVVFRETSGCASHSSKAVSSAVRLDLSVAQMLASLDHNVVVSEAAPIDAVVRARDARPDLSDDEHGRWLKWMVGALGRLRCGDEANYFIKLDSWHTLALPLFRRVVPDVPWIFLYRDPVEVLVSQLRTSDTGNARTKSNSVLLTRLDLSVEVLANEREYLPEHQWCQHAGIRVVARTVVAIEQLQRTDLAAAAMTEGMG